jgi:hypothetical protein
MSRERGRLWFVVSVQEQLVAERTSSALTFQLDLPHRSMGGFLRRLRAAQ